MRPTNNAVPKNGSPFRWISAGATLAGKVRADNEDAILDSPGTGLWAVADGMGGHSAGDYASAMVVGVLANVPPADRPSRFVDSVESRLLAVNSRLYQSGVIERRGLRGSTVLALLAYETLCVVLWAGDSRLYRYRGGQLEQMSRDHSQVQAMRDAGLLQTEADVQSAPSNIITRAVGAAESLHLEYGLWSIEPEDRCLLCSDGLYNEVSPAEIVQQLAQEDPQHACDSLLQAALSGEASDNMSAIVVRFIAASDASTSTPRLQGLSHA
jgi:protein phosphatase